MSSPRFDDFRGMTSRRNSTGCVNSKDHTIKRGDYIGWSRQHRLACCEACWQRWEHENANAQEWEDRYCTPEYGFGYEER